MNVASKEDPEILLKEGKALSSMLYRFGLAPLCTETATLIDVVDITHLTVEGTFLKQLHKYFCLPSHSSWMLIKCLFIA